MTTQAKIERMCRKAGLTLEDRVQIHGIDIFMADGFVADPHRTLRRFLDEDDDFPYGCFFTQAFIGFGEGNVTSAHFLVFDAFHDSDKNMSVAQKKQARLNAMREVVELNVSIYEANRVGERLVQ